MLALPFDVRPPTGPKLGGRPSSRRAVPVCVAELGTSQVAASTEVTVNPSEQSAAQAVHDVPLDSGKGIGHESADVEAAEAVDAGECHENTGESPAADLYRRQRAWIMENAGDFVCPEDLMLAACIDDLSEEDHEFLQSFIAEMEAAYATSSVSSREVDLDLFAHLFSRCSQTLTSALAGAPGRALRGYMGKPLAQDL